MSKAWPGPGIDPAGTLAENARKILAVRTAEYFSYAPIVDIPEAVEQLHALRIAAKRLRYTLELFSPVLGPDIGDLLAELKTLQDLLGELHDRDVMIDSLSKARKNAAPKERPGIDRLITRLEGERDSARAEMVRYLNDLMTGDVPHEVEAQFGPEAAPATETKDAA